MGIVYVVSARAVQSAPCSTNHRLHDLIEAVLYMHTAVAQAAAPSAPPPPVARAALPPPVARAALPPPVARAALPPPVPPRPSDPMLEVVMTKHAALPTDLHQVRSSAAQIAFIDLAAYAVYHARARANVQRLHPRMTWSLIHQQILKLHARASNMEKCVAALKEHIQKVGAFVLHWIYLCSFLVFVVFLQEIEICQKAADGSKYADVSLAAFACANFTRNRYTVLADRPKILRVFHSVTFPTTKLRRGVLKR